MTSPAQVSGPGALSRRTDAGGQPIRSLPDPKYGEAQEFAQQQKAAPLAEAPGAPPGPAPSDIARKLMSAPGPEQGAPQGEPGLCRACSTLVIPRFRSRLVHRWVPAPIRLLAARCRVRSAACRSSWRSTRMVMRA